jgi:hypothetical protein
MFAKVRRAVGSTLGIFALLGAAVLASPAAAHAYPGRTPGVGVQFQAMWTTLNDGQRVRVLDTLRDAGVTTVRIDVSWAMLQPDDRDSFDPWGTAFVDRMIELCNAYGFTPLVTLWLTPGWANHYAGSHTLPSDPHDYARVARWVAHRYTNRVAGWEVWNEENSPDFLVGADPVAYTRLLQAAYPAFHAGYADTTVVFGGLEYNDDRWLDRAYAAGVHGAFDVMATHPYMGIASLPPDSVGDGQKWTFLHASVVHDLMVAHGDADKSLWFTEFGWSTHENPPGTPNWQAGVSEAEQASNFTIAIEVIRTRMPYVGKVYWYNEHDARSDGIVQNDHYGVLRADLSPKPIVDAISAVTR